MDVWKEFSVTLRVKSVSADKQIRELTGKFDFSKYVPNIQLQYVVTRDLKTFQQWMKKREYDIVLSENSIDVTYHVKQRRTFDIEIIGHELCAEISHFLSGYSLKPILVPEKPNTEYVNTVTEINQGNLSCEIFWEPERHSYWITGKYDDVMKAYQLFQQKKKELWFHVVSSTKEKELQWRKSTTDTAHYDDFEIKFEINTKQDRRLTTRGGTFKVTEYLDMPVIQYMFTHDRKYFRSCTKAAGLSYQFSEGILTLACRSPLQCTDLDEIGVKLTNFIVHVTSIYNSQLLVVPEKIREKYSTKLNVWISGGENKLFAECVWMADGSAVRLTCPLEHYTDNYTVLRELLESCIRELEYAQSPVDVLCPDVTSSTSNDVMEKWNRTIEVSGVRETTTLDSVEFYFENSKISGGATVDDIVCKDGRYHITFDSPDAVEHVLKRKHKIEGVEVEVQKHIPFTVEGRKKEDKTDHAVSDTQMQNKGATDTTLTCQSREPSVTGDDDSGYGFPDKNFLSTGTFTVKEKHFYLTDLAFELLQYPETQQYFNKLLKGKGVNCSWSVAQMPRKPVLLVKESNEAKCDMVGKMFDENIYEIEFPSDALLIKSPQWEKLRKQFAGKFVFSDLTYEEFSVVATSDVIDKLSYLINEILNHSLCNKRLRISPKKAQYLQEIGKDSIDQICHQFVVTIDCSKSGCVEIYGNREDIQAATKAFEDIVDQICIEKIVEDGQVFAECLEEQDTNIKSLEKHCLIQTQEFTRHEEPLHVCNWILDSTFFCLMKGSPVDVTADMIVCPTNTSLYPIAGGKEIMKESGPDPLDETQEYMSKHGAQLKPGKHFISNTVGDLNFQFICHLATESNKETADPVQIGHWLLNMFIEADMSGIQSIVLPVALSSTSGLPVVTRQIATAVCSYGQHRHPNLNEIYVTVEDDDDVCFEVTKILKEEMANSKNVTSFDFQPLLPSKSGKEDKQRENVKIRIMEGSLLDQVVDVLVNTTGKQLDLSLGFVSNTFLKAAGKGIQDECKRQKPHGLSEGEVIMTSSGDLKSCKKICHGVLPRWIPRTNLSLRILKLFMWQCLSHTDINKYSTIAFPVLGTGKLQYPWRQVAKTMIECIEEFGRENPGTTLQEARIVMYHADKDVIKAFEIVQRKRNIIKAGTEVQQVLESNKTTRTGNKKVLVTYTKDMAMCDCEMFVFLTSTSSFDADRKSGYNDDAECWTLRCQWDGSQEKLIDVVKFATTEGEEKRVQSMAFIIRDCSESSQTKKMKMRETIQTLKVQFYQTELRYLQVVKICVPTMAILDRIVEKTQKNKKDEKKSKLSALFGNIWGFKSDAPVWNVVKTRKVLEKQRSVKITLVGSRAEVKKVQRELRTRFTKIKSKMVWLSRS